MTKIMAISGKPGLYRIVGQMKNGVVVEGLEDGKRFPAYASDKLSLLSEISIYTDEGDLPLGDVLNQIKESLNGAEAGSGKEEIISQFEAAVPEYDRERVYASDMKKVMKWYNELVKANWLPEEEGSSEEE